MEIQLNTSAGATQVLRTLQGALILDYSEQKLLLVCNSLTHKKKNLPSQKSRVIHKFFTKQRGVAGYRLPGSRYHT